MDILIFAALAFFIFFKLNKELGKIDEEEQKNMMNKISEKKKKIVEVQNQIISQTKQKLKDSIETTNLQIEQYLSKLDESSKNQFFEILQKSNITIEFFINGMKSAFEMILQDFMQGNVKNLQLLLSPKIFESFEAAINDRKSKSQNLVTNLIAIENIEIIAVNLSGNIANITANIDSKQINYITNNNNEVIEGSKDQISIVNDVWTLQRDLSSNNPNWFVVATAAN